MTAGCFSWQQYRCQDRNRPRKTFGFLIFILTNRLTNNSFGTLFQRANFLNFLFNGIARWWSPVCSLRRHIAHPPFPHLFQDISFTTTHSKSRSIFRGKPFPRGHHAREVNRNISIYSFCWRRDWARLKCCWLSQPEQQQEQQKVFDWLIKGMKSLMSLPNSIT